jgi:uncharacterized protein (TIGR01244 family)
MRRHYTTVACIAGLAAVAASGCPGNDASRHQTPKAIESAELGSAPNVHRLGTVWFSGQPGTADLQEAAAAGITTVVDLRLPEEDRGFDEAEAVEDLGMTYVNVGFKTPESLTDEVLDGFRSVLRDSADAMVLVHCGSANRAGAAWLAYRVLDEGRSLEDGLAEARTIGLQTPEYEERVKTYISERHRQ